MNQHDPHLRATQVLETWRNASAGTVKAVDLTRALESMGATVYVAGDLRPQRLGSPLTRHLSVLYNGASAQVHYTDQSLETVRKPEGLKMYNMLNSILARR